ncbi:MAG TPA: hypothetical protein VGP07_08805 [Polyangia bacterium]|jgi:hypothetical protein
MTSRALFGGCLAALLCASARPAAAATATPALGAPLRRVLVSGCRDGVAELAALAASGQPGSDTAAQVVRLCADIRAHAPAAETPDPASPPRVDRNGRAQLVIGTTLYGIWLGISIDVLADVQNDRLVVLYPLLGMAAGLGGSLYGTHGREVTTGQAWSIITGLDYGTYNGLLWSAAISGSPTRTGVFTGGLVAGAVGGGVGLYVAAQHPQQGAVEMVRSGGLYGTGAALMGALLLAPEDVSSRTMFTTLAIGMDAGLATGGVLSAELDLSRNRMLLIDAGTLAGLGFGLGGTWLITGSKGSSRRALGAGGLVGMGAGFVAAILLTRHLDDEHTAQAAAPTLPALVSRDLRGRWNVGTLTLVPVADPTGRRQGMVGASVPLAAGLW